MLERGERLCVGVCKFGVGDGGFNTRHETDARDEDGEENRKDGESGGGGEGDVGDGWIELAVNGERYQRGVVEAEGGGI